MPLRCRRPAAAVLVLLLGLGACSGGGDDSGGAAQPAAPATTGRPGPVTTAGPGSAVAASAAPSTEYCGLARKYAKAFERFGQPGTSADMRSYYTDASTAMDQARQVAPSELKGDLDVVADGLHILMGGLDSIGYDFSRLPTLGPDLIIRLMTQQFVDSLTRVAVYGRDKCGIS